MALDRSPEYWHMKKLCIGMCFKDIIQKYFYFSSGGHVVQLISFGRGHHEEHI